MMSPAKYSKISLESGGEYALVPIADCQQHSLSSLLLEALGFGNGSEFSLAQLVKVNRLLKGISLETLSELTGVEKKQLWKLENAKVRRPHANTLLMLARVFGPHFNSGLVLLGFEVLAR